MLVGPSSSSALRGLAERKIQIQSGIEATKPTLKSQIADLQALQVEIREDEEAAVKSQQMLAERVLKNVPRGAIVLK